MTSPESEGPAAVAPGEGGEATGEDPQHVVIVGGGRVGRDLAQRFQGAVVVEPDPGRVRRLQDRFPDLTVVAGSGTDPEVLRAAGVDDADAVVAVASNDQVNLKVVTTAIPIASGRVVARVDDPRNVDRFEEAGAVPVTGPLSRAPSMIYNLVRPGKRSLYEVVITEGSPVVGERVEDIDLPSSATVVIVLRGDHLVSPDPDLVLQRGDVLTIVSPDDQASDALEAVTVHDGGFNPIGEILVLVEGPEDVHGSLKEAFLLAQSTRATLHVVTRHDAGGFLEAPELVADLEGVELHRHEAQPGEEASDVMVRILNAFPSAPDGARGEPLRLVVLPPGQARGFSRLLRRSQLHKLLEETGHPVLVARRGAKVGSILALLDASPGHDSVVRASVDTALLTGSDLTALIVEDHETESEDRLLTYLERVGQVYGVDVEAQHVQGHPILELVMLARDMEPDLVVLPWRSPTVRRDILRRFIREGPGSVLLVP